MIYSGINKDSGNIKRADTKKKQEINSSTGYKQTEHIKTLEREKHENQKILGCIVIYGNVRIRKTQKSRITGVGDLSRGEKKPDRKIREKTEDRRVRYKRSMQGL